MTKVMPVPHTHRLCIECGMPLSWRAGPRRKFCAGKSTCRANYYRKQREARGEVRTRGGRDKETWVPIRA